MEYTSTQLRVPPGIYYDDVFLHACYTPQPAGPGYVGDDGMLHAGVNLWAWRDFLRRTAVMQHVSGRKVTAIYNHMTNVNVVPWLSWGSVSLDWEWRDDATQAEQDVQTRNLIGCDDHGLRCNDTSFILAQSTGLQSGTISVGISSGLRGPRCASRPDLNKSCCQDWLLKTHYATTIPHEMRPMGHFWNSNTIIPASPDGHFAETRTVELVPRILDSFGYGDAACDVYRFWEPEFPIETSGATVLPLVVRCPPNEGGNTRGNSRILVFFGSFGPRGDINFRLDRSVLGISENARAKDAESNATVAGVNGSWSLPIDKHSFRIVIVSDDA